MVREDGFGCTLALRLRGITALFSGLALACTLAPERPREAEGVAPQWDALRVAAVEVEASGELTPGDLRSLARYEVKRVLRQSTLDWLEHHQRFGLQGELRVEIRVDLEDADRMPAC